MTITLKQCTSEKNHLEREFTATTADHTGTLRGSASLSDPVIQIPATADIAGYNYAEIPTFGRKYFITDTPVLVNGMWELHLHVDAIGTWLNEIKACPVMLDEGEQAPDYYMNDGHVMMEDRTIEQVLFFHGNTDPDEGDDYYVDEDGYCCFDPNGWQYILITQGPGTTIAPTP